MESNLQQKYEELKVVCKKQEAQIAKLQREIRQRYQSFYLQNSRFKKGETPPAPEVNDNEGSVKSFSPNSKLNDRKSSQTSSDKGKSEIFQQQIKSTIKLNLTLNKQVELFVQPYKQDKTQEINQNALMIESFKNRIAGLQSSKNDVVKELQKVSSEAKSLKLKVSTLEKSVQVLGKSQKKLKDKLKKLPQYEEKIDEIYIKLMREVKKEEFNEESQIQKHLNEKIEEIISWISQSKQKVDNLLDDFNHLEATETESPNKNLQREQPVESPSKPKEELALKIQQSYQIAIQPYSPSKNQSKVPGETWTIISKLNEVDIKPFQASEVKPYILASQPSYNNQQEVEGEAIKILEENSLIIEQELKQSKHQISQLRSELSIHRNKSNQLSADLQNSVITSAKIKEQLEDKVKKLTEELQISRRNNLALEQKLNNNLSIFNELNESLNSERKNKDSLRQQLEKSQLKVTQLEELKVSKQVQSLQDSQNISKLNTTQPDSAASKMTVTEQLEAPYYVQQELETQPNDQYVKRSFIRKKIVRRNLSATAYRIVSKSREEVDQIISKKIDNYREMSKEKAAKLKIEKTEKQNKQSLQKGYNRISEVSQPRDSDIKQQEVRIIEVTTATPNEQIRTAKIYTKGGESNISTRRKY